MLAKIQPKNTPGIAAGVKAGNSVKISASLNCIGPNPIGFNGKYNNRYSAAIIAARAM